MKAKTETIGNPDLVRMDRIDDREDRNRRLIMAIVNI